MSGKQRETRAAELLAGVRHVSDPDAAAAREVEWLEHATETAERRQAREEEFLAQAIELMRRTEQARRAATRAATERTRIEGDRRREKERLRKNALARERYAGRRLTEPARLDKRIGMHALAIQVNPVAYRAVKAEALKRGNSIPTVLGEILSDSSRRPIAAPKATGPRWRRTGEGRKANQHTRIDIADDAWGALHREALQGGVSLARGIGIILEVWSESECPTSAGRRPSSR